MNKSTFYCPVLVVRNMVWHVGDYRVGLTSRQPPTVNQKMLLLMLQLILQPNLKTLIIKWTLARPCHLKS